MKILRIIASVNPSEGGPIEGLKNTAREMEMLGHQTEVICLDEPTTPWVTEFPFKVYALGPTVGKYGYTRKLSSWIKNHGAKYDAAVVHGLWNHATLSGAIALRNINLPYVIYTHGMLDPWFRKTYPLKHLMKQIYWIWQGAVLRHASFVLFTSTEECSSSIGAFYGYNYRTRVVSYGVRDHEEFERGEKKDLNEIIPLLGQRRYILFLSRIHLKKGCDMLIEAFASIANTDSNLDLVIAGPDSNGLKSALISRCKDLGIEHRVHWPGMLKGAAKFGAFRYADAFILPSHQENFGIVVAESLASGTPVLITDKVNIWSDILSSGSGLVEADTQFGVTMLLQKWSNMTKEHRNEMRKRARETYLNKFTVKMAAIDLTNSLYDAIEMRDHPNAD